MPDTAARAGGALAWPVRLLVVSDFSGGRDRREIRRADGTPIDDLLAATAPRITIGSLPPGELEFRRLADFAPESLRSSLPGRDGEAPSASDLDSALHAPAFQSIESAWRGLAFLLAQVAAAPCGSGDAHGAARVDLIDIDTSALRRSPEILFSAAFGDPARHYTAILIDLDLGAAPADGAFLEALATQAERRRTPALLGTAPALLGLQHAAHLPGILDPAARLDAALNGAWRTFRESDAARWIGLTVNRILLRSPYTQDTAGHQESASPARPGDYLWGRGIWLAGADLLRSARDQGHPLALSGIFPERFHLGRPLWSWKGAGGARQSSAIEAAFDQDAVQRFVRAGLSPILEPAGAGTAVLPLVVNAFRPDPRRIPVEGTLAHTLILAHFVSAIARAAPLLAAEPDDKAAGALLRGELSSALGPRFAGETATALEASIERKAQERIASASLRGDLTGSGRDEEIQISIPLSMG